jgi:hypothetical protein
MLLAYWDEEQRKKLAIGDCLLGGENNRVTVAFAVMLLSLDRG